MNETTILWIVVNLMFTLKIAFLALAPPTGGYVSLVRPQRAAHTEGSPMARTAVLVKSPILGIDVPSRDWNVKGSEVRALKRVYAAMVTASMGGVTLSDMLPCPLCGNVFNWITSGDCDRVRPMAGYQHGNLAMVCRECNESRGFVQQRGADLPGVARYAADVFVASLAVGAMTMTGRDAMALVASYGHGSERRQRVGNVGQALATLLSGPYGKA